MPNRRNRQFKNSRRWEPDVSPLESLLESLMRDELGGESLGYALMAGDFESTTDPLLRAILDKDEKAAISFIQRAQDVNFGDVVGRTPLHYAAYKGFTAIVDLLIQKGAKIERREKRKGSTPLYIATTYDHKDFVESLLKRGADVNAVGPNDQTPLFWAAFNNNLEMAKVLIQHGADANAKAKSDATPLLKAKKEMSELLIEAGADIKWKDPSNRNLLFYAVLDGDEEKANLLMSKGVDAKVDGILHQAVKKEWSSKDFIESLIQKGADVNFKDEVKETPLSKAVAEGKAEVVKTLIAKGACVNSKNVLLMTPLQVAAIGGCLEIAKILIESGADVNARDCQGSSIMHMGAMSPQSTKHLEFTLLLLKCENHAINQPDKFHEKLGEAELKSFAEFLVKCFKEYDQGHQGEYADNHKLMLYGRQLQRAIGGGHWDLGSIRALLMKA